MALTFQDSLSVLIQILVYAGLVQGFYSALVLTHTKLRNPANNYLAALMVVLSFTIMHSVFIIPWFHRYHPVSVQLKEPFVLLVVPFIWLYLKKLNEPQFQFRQKHLLHFLPFVIVMLFSILFLIHHSDTAAYDRFYHPTLLLNIFLYLVALCQYLFYLAYMVRLIRNFRSKALNELSNTENIDPAWLMVFLIIFLIVFLILILMMVVAIHRIDAGYFNNATSVVFALAIYILGYKGLFQHSILTDTTILSSLETKSEENASREMNVDTHLVTKLLEYMKTQKPYRDPELTLTSLASQLALSRNSLSEIINSGTGSNFYDFVNKHRVEEVKQLLENPKFKDYTILAIAFEAGFPSKSTFNSIFKKFTGLTPSKYRNRLL